MAINDELSIIKTSADAVGASLELLKRRSLYALVASNDVLGELVFAGSDGTVARNAAKIQVAVDTTPGASDMPGRMVFYTTPNGSTTLTEALRIDNAQNMIIANGKRLETDEVRARDSGGLALKDDGGNLGVFIEDGGQVGVNTAAPAAALEVLGDVIVSRVGNAPVITFHNTNDIAVNPDVLFTTNGFIAAESGIYLAIDSNNDSTNAALIVGKDAQTSAFTELMRVQEDGSVGIGAASPLFKLHVDSDTTITAVHVAAHGGVGVPGEGAIILAGSRGTHASPTATQATDVIGSVYFQGWDTARSTGAQIYAIAAAEWGTAGDTSDDPTDLRFATVPNGSGTLADRLTITSEGLVGIASTAPLTLLHVGAGADALTASNVAVNIQTAGATALAVRNAADNVEGFIVADTTLGAIGTATNHPFFIRTNQLDAVAIDTSQRVGIGTAIPGALLEVLGSAIISKSGGTPVITLSNADDISVSADILVAGNAILAAETSFYVAIDSNNDSTTAAFRVGKDAATSSMTELMRVQEDGNTGISNANPQALLHVGAGADAPTTTNTVIYASRAGTTNIVARNSTDDVEARFGVGALSGTFGTATNSPFLFVIAGAEVARVDTTGYLGINDTTPDGMLDVAQTSTTAAVPTLELHQSDLSEEFINFVTTVGVGNPTEAVGAKTLTTTHFIRIQIDGVGYRYIPVGTIA